MMSAEKKKNASKKRRSTKALSLTKATLMVAQLLLAQNDPELAESLFNPSYLPSPAAKQRFKESKKDAIRQAAFIVSRASMRDVLKKATADDLVSAIYQAHRLAKKGIEEIRKKDEKKELMDSVWNKVWDHRIVRNHRRHLLSFDDGDARVEKWKKKMESKVVSDWKASVRKLKRAAALAEKLATKVEILIKELGDA